MPRLTGTDQRMRFLGPGSTSEPHAAYRCQASRVSSSLFGVYSFTRPGSIMPKRADPRSALHLPLNRNGSTIH